MDMGDTNDAVPEPVEQADTTVVTVDEDELAIQAKALEMFGAMDGVCKAAEVWAKQVGEKLGGVYPGCPEYNLLQAVNVYQAMLEGLKRAMS